MEREKIFKKGKRGRENKMEDKCRLREREGNRERNKIQAREIRAKKDLGNEKKIHKKN